LFFVFRLYALEWGHLVLLVDNVFVGFLGCVSFEHAHGRLRLVCDGRVIEAGHFGVAVAQHCIKIISFENVVHCLMEDVLHHVLAFTRVSSELDFFLFTIRLDFLG
jgi:hypothetical protein